MGKPYAWSFSIPELNTPLFSSTADDDDDDGMDIHDTLQKIHIGQVSIPMDGTVEGSTGTVNQYSSQSPHAAALPPLPPTPLLLWSPPRLLPEGAAAAAWLWPHHSKSSTSKPVKKDPDTQHSGSCRFFPKASAFAIMWASGKTRYSFCYFGCDHCKRTGDHHGGPTSSSDHHHQSWQQLERVWSSWVQVCSQLH